MAIGIDNIQQVCTAENSQPHILSIIIKKKNKKIHKIG